MLVPQYSGCYYVVAPAPQQCNYPTIRWLPQVALSAHTTILSTTSRTVLTQTFTNPSATDAISEATYTFPLYEGVGVVGFSCQIGKRIIRGVVKEKSKAKAVYEKAKASGETAGLLVQLPESRDVFTTKIGNIPADEKVIVEITYLGELKHDAQVDAIRFTIPTKIAPRYGELPGGIVEPGTDSNSRQAQGTTGIQITVNVTLPAKSTIRGIQSPSHPIAVTMGNTATSSGSSEFHPNRGGATLSLGTAQLEQDFVLLVLAPDIIKPRALLETHPTIPNQRALMVTLVPKFALPPSNPEIVFIVDRSGSMRGNVPTVVSALKVFLKSLPVGVKFNICSFGSSYSLLWQRSKSYDQSTLTEAIKHVEKFDANFGGTQMFEPIKAVIDNRYKDMALEVMLLTDGEIWNQQELFSYLNKEVQETGAPIRVFTLGIGNSVSHSLIEGIARAGNGFSQAVGLEEKLDGKVVRMLKGGLSPHIKDYSLEVKYGEEGWEAIEKVSDSLHILSISNSSSFQDVPAEVPQKKKISLFDEDVDMDWQPTATPDPDGTIEKYAHLPDIPPPKLLQAPTHIPALFPFSRTDVYVVMSPQSCQLTPTAVVLRGTSEHGPLELEIPVQILEEAAETIHQLAARKAIGELEEGRGWIFASTDEGGAPIRERFDGRWEDIVEREAVRLGVQFQVGGKWCSYVAVEQNQKDAIQKDDHEGNSETNDSGYVVVTGTPGQDPMTDLFSSGAPLQSVDRSSLSLAPNSFNRPWSRDAKLKKEFSAAEHPADSARVSAFQMHGGRAEAMMGSNKLQTTTAPALFGSAPSNKSLFEWPSAAAMMGSNKLQTTTAPALFGSAPSNKSSFEWPSAAAMMGSNKLQTTTAPALFGSAPSNKSSFEWPKTHVSCRILPQPSQKDDPPIHWLRASGHGMVSPQSVPSENKPRARRAMLCRTASRGARASAVPDQISDTRMAEDYCFGIDAEPESQPDDKLHSLVALQSFEGAWELDESLCSILGLGARDEVCLRAEQKWWRALATVLAVVFLEEKLAADRSAWELVVQKGRVWLAACGVEPERLADWEGWAKGLLVAT